MPKRLIFVRHGETAENALGKLIGWQSDPGLSDVGKNHALEVGSRLARYQIHAVNTSDLRRTQETAEIICNIINHVPTPTQLLRERDLGIFDNHTFHEVRIKWPHHAAKFTDHQDIHWKEHQGESLHEVSLRFSSLHRELRKQHNNETVLLVTHGGYTHTVLRDYFHFFPLESYTDVAHNSITILDRVGEGYSLTAYNQTNG